MSPSLREELFAYAACRLDDTVSESPHRDVSWVAGRARASKIPWWSASVRLRQNLRMLEDPVVGPVMMRMWPRWRTLAVPASSPWSPGALRAKPFLDAVHRVGAYAHVDASSIAVAHRDVYLETLRAREASLPLPARVWRDLRREFVRAVVADGHVYSAQLPREGPPSAQAMVSQEASSSLPTEQHFRVLDGALAQKKHNLTLRWLQVKSMAMPMSIQKFATVAVGGSQTTVDPGASEQRTLVPEGLPEVIDFLAFIPWDTVRSGMKTWSVVSGSSAGGGGAVNVGKPVALSERAWVFTDPGTPLCVLIDVLLERGWKACPTRQCPQSHRAEPAVAGAGARGSMLFPLARLRLQWKPYFQCLLSLQQLAAKGLVELPAREQPAYYRAVLASDAPGEVESAVGGRGGGGAAAAADVDMSDEPLEGHVGHGLAAMRARAGNAEQRLPDSVAVAGVAARSDDDMQPLQPVPDVAVDHSGRGRGGPRGEAYTGLWRPGALMHSPTAVGSQRRPSSSSSGSSSSTSSTSAVADRGRGSAAPPQPPEPQGTRGRHVDGVAVAVEEHSGGPGRSYRRLAVQCPVHTSCKKRRNISAAHCKNLGENEPLWFLGAWVRYAEDTQCDRSSHMAFTPSLREVQRFRASGRWSADAGGESAAPGSGGHGRGGGSSAASAAVAVDSVGQA